jgi:hypothetical protein
METPGEVRRVSSGMKLKRDLKDTGKRCGFEALLGVDRGCNVNVRSGIN